MLCWGEQWLLVVCTDVLHSEMFSTHFALHTKSPSVLVVGSYRSPTAPLKSAVSVLQLLALSLLEAAPKLLSMVTCSTNSSPSLLRYVLSAPALGAEIVSVLELGFVCSCVAPLAHWLYTALPPAIT